MGRVAVIGTGQDVRSGFNVRTQVCVIGSGAGGGVAAALLAEAGREVLVLEEGPYVAKERMTQREHEMFPRLFRDGHNQMTADGGVLVEQGRVVGGSTVVNMADVVAIPRPILDHWKTAFGVDRYGWDRVHEAAGRCMAAISANAIQPDQVNRNNDLLLTGARKNGLQGGTFIHNRVGCTGSGYCLLGCAYDAKKSVALTWLPRALATGHARVQADARVDRLEADGGRIVAAVGSVLDETSQRPVAPFRVVADEFVLAAGSIHSPVVLLRSGLGGTQVGRNLSLQPQAPVAAVFDQRVTMWRGIPQSVYVDSEERITAEAGLAGFRLEGVAAQPGMASATVSMAAGEVHAFMRQYPQAAACLCLVPDRPSGSVRATRQGRAEIHYAFSEPWKDTMRRAVRAAAEAYLSAGATGVMLPGFGLRQVRKRSDLDVLDGWKIRPAEGPMISAHPQGTCRMGPTASTSVVDPLLRVHGVANLRVLDASVFPTTSSSHTMVPVMTFAMLAAEDMLSP